LRRTLGARFAGSLLLTLTSTAAGFAVPLRVAVDVAGDVPAAKAVAEVVFTSRTRDGREDRRSASVAAPGTAAFDLPPGTAWTAAVEAAGLWAPRRVVEVGAEGASYRVALVPAGTLAGEIRMPPGKADPQQITVRLRPAPGAPMHLGEHTLPCPVVARHFRCTVPAGDLDLRLRVPGYLSLYRWGAHVGRGTFETGTLELKPGASVVGWLQAPADRDFRFSDCKIELQPQAVARAFDSKDLARRGELALTAGVNDRGFFEITGVAPGAYSLVARHPRYAPARLAPVDVLAGGETEVKSIALEAAVAFEVRVDPSRDPYQSAWVIHLQKKGGLPGYAAEAAAGPVSAEGTWRRTGLEPGQYVLVVEGSLRSFWHREDLEVAAGMPAHDVHLPVVRVEGQVTLGRRPLRALLWFGGTHGAVRVYAKSDEEGKFEVSLPVRERWSADVSNASLHLAAHVDEIDARPAPGASRARVRIELPDTAVRGVVVDESGKAMPDVLVQAFPEVQGDPAVAHSTAPDGRFELRALKPQGWSLEAAMGDGDTGLEAEPVRVEVTAERPAEGIRLVLRRCLRLAGMVVSPEGQGVPGARVMANLEQDQRFLSSVVPETFTDIDGKFDLKLPAATQGVQLTVLPPGFSITQIRVQAGRPEPIVVPVSPVGGTIVVSFTPDPTKPALVQRLATTLFSEFRVGSPRVLEDWAMAHGVEQGEPGRFVIPMVEPGKYTACPDVWLQTFETGRLPGPLAERCASGDLAPFGELLLKLPAPGRSAPPK
jgi:hypothetical protein